MLQLEQQWLTYHKQRLLAMAEKAVNYYGGAGTKLTWRPPAVCTVKC